jgi:hypothetical protein
MAIDYFSASPIVVNGTTLLGGQSLSYEPGREIFAPQNDGGVVHLIAGVSRCTPTVAITTKGVKAMLDILAASGAGVPLPYLDLTGLTMVGRKGSPNAPTFAAGSVHEQVAMADGCLAFTGLEASANEDAVLSAVAYGIAADGDTDPVVLSQVAAPAAPSAIAPYVLDSVTLDGTAVEEVSGVSVSASIDWQVEHGLKPFPILVRPRFVDWTLTVRHADLGLMRTKLDKAATGSFVLKNRQTGGPTRGSSTVSISVVGVLYQGTRTDPATGNVETVTTIRGAGVTPATWATT